MVFSALGLLIGFARAVALAIAAIVVGGLLAVCRSAPIEGSLSPKASLAAHNQDCRARSAATTGQLSWIVLQA